MILLADDIVSVETLSAEILLQKGYRKVLIIDEENDFLRSILRNACEVQTEDCYSSPEVIIAYGKEKTIIRAKTLGETLGVPVNVIPSSFCMSAISPYRFFKSGVLLYPASSRVILVDDILSSDRSKIKDGFAVAAALLMQTFDSAFEDRLFDRDVSSNEKTFVFRETLSELLSIKTSGKDAYKVIKKAVLSLLPHTLSSQENLSYKLSVLFEKEGEGDLFACAFAIFSAYVSYEPNPIFFTTDRVKTLEISLSHFSTPFLYAEAVDVDDFPRKKYVVDILAPELKESLKGFENLALVYRRIYGSGGYHLRSLSLPSLLSLLPVLAESGLDFSFLKYLYLTSHLDSFLSF